MKRSTILGLILVFAFAVAAFLLPALGPQVLAQQACAEFQAIGFGTLPTPHQLNPTDTWGGDFWGTLGGQLISGAFTGNDGNAVGHGNSNKATNGHYVFSIGTDSFTMEVAHAVFNFPPGNAGFGNYKGHATIVQGTGRFQNASGSIDWEGPFIVWTPDGTNYQGRFDPTITGNICDAQ